MAANKLTEQPFRIALLDDRSTQRQTMIRGIGAVLPHDWECIECPLLEDLEQYAAWLVNNRILVFLVDQLLNERADDVEHPVDYKGHDVVRSVRKRLVDFPIFIVTQAVEDPDLASQFGEADGIVGRAEFMRDQEQFIQRFSRQGRTFLHQFENELAEIGDLSKKAAMGNSTAKDAKRLKSLQSKLGLPLHQPSDSDDALQPLLSHLARLEDLRERVDKFLRGSEEVEEQVTRSGRPSAKKKTARKGKSTGESSKRKSIKQTKKKGDGRRHRDDS